MTATELNERANAYGTKVFAQITMGLGRNYPDLPAPSSVHVFRHPGVVSPELTHDQIKSKIESVIKAAKLPRILGSQVWKSTPSIGGICWISLPCL